jgi:hypothetical protein
MDFYNTSAQVIPVLVLALAWESNYPQQLANEDRTTGFWKMKRVAAWSYFCTAAAVFAEAMCLLVVASIVDPGVIPKIVAFAGLTALIGSLLTRVFADIRRVSNWPRRSRRVPPPGF